MTLWSVLDWKVSNWKLSFLWIKCRILFPSIIYSGMMIPIRRTIPRILTRSKVKTGTLCSIIRIRKDRKCSVWAINKVSYYLICLVGLRIMLKSPNLSRIFWFRNGKRKVTKSKFSHINSLIHWFNCLIKKQGLINSKHLMS
jgi:hypothetical protein